MKIAWTWVREAWSAIRRPWVVWRQARPGSDVRLEVRQPAAPLLLLALLVGYILSPTALMVMAFSAVLAIVGVALIWTLDLARKVSVRRSLRYDAFQVGDELEENVEIENGSIFPVLWAEFTDQSDLPGYSLTSVQAASGRSTNGWRAKTVCERRGVFALGPYDVRMGDPFGIFTARQVYAKRREILVYPPLAPLPPHLLPHRSAQGERRPLYQPLAAQTMEAYSTRPYQPGDPLRHVHWRTTARRGETFVRLFEPEAASSVWLLPDLDASEHRSLEGLDPLDSSLETMMIAAASLAAQLLNEQIAVGLLPGDPANVILPRRGTAHLWNLLIGLAPLQAQRGRPLAEAIAQQRALLAPSDLLVVLTPSLDPAWLGALRSLNGLQHAGARALLLDPASFGGSRPAEDFLPLLAQSGVSGAVIRRGDLQPVRGTYGRISRWEFKQLATGRVLVEGAPRAAEESPA